MAPSGPRRGSAPSGLRNGRGSATKTGGRGGIAKRRGNAALRVDRDGDLDMDAPTGTNRSSQKAKRANHHDSIPTAPRANRQVANGSRAPRASVKAQQIIQRALANGIPAGPRGAQRVNAQETMTLQVAGLKSSKAAHNEGGGLKELLNFLERKAQTVGKTTRPIRIKKSHIIGDLVQISTSKQDGEEILKVDGFTFAGTPLAITEVPGGQAPLPEANLSSSALEIKDQLRNVLSLRYNPTAKLLNLSTLGEDQILNQMGFFSGESKPEKLFKALMAVCDGLFKTPQDKRQAVASVSLAGNNIDDVHQIMALADTFPDLVNLDLSRNHFKDLRGLQKWRHRLRKLETFLLNENPIETTTPSYREEVTAWFPRLQNLSNVQVRSPEQVTAMELASRPTPIPQNGADFRDINGIGEGFIKEFIPMYDSDRTSLAGKYYEDESTFSISVNNTAPRSSSYAQQAGWGSYIKFSRNHVKITHENTRSKRVFFGPNLIRSVWDQLPATRHPNLLGEFNKYIIDCHPIHGLYDPTSQNRSSVDGMVLTIHGEFDDQEPVTLKTAKRSFSRTFVLGPGTPNRNPIRVISDVLVVRPFSPLPSSAPAPAPAQVQAPVPGLVPNAAPAAQPNLELQQQMVIEVCNRTGMTPEYSKLCLDGVNWNFDQALVMFNDKRAQLPAEAFANPSQ
ncbi:NTF2-like protein [Annulohypoxylon maeteangense]|uniref:NTF2-like protein n=1 Tax=Annulohypoxylon maeteangense TaxID=1927788 RepID=UPI002008924D|nr:NTF2-like protein [Annulohypoxylon maeteangense]KAI0890656.1 NTF2-like protein [Annulohypoxylon maeteangense]